MYKACDYEHFSIKKKIKKIILKNEMRFTTTKKFVVKKEINYFHFVSSIERK